MSLFNMAIEACCNLEAEEAVCLKPDGAVLPLGQLKQMLYATDGGKLQSVGVESCVPSSLPCTLQASLLHLAVVWNAVASPMLKEKSTAVPKRFSSDG